MVTPPDGIAIMQHEDMDACVKPIVANCDQLIGLVIELGNKKCVLLNVYMPYYCHENRELYVEKLNAILTELN